jgi:phosphoinositide-3-kinase regulatory subunit 4
MAAVLLANVICSNIRNCLYPTSKLRAIDMLLVLGVHMEDEFRLDRIVPYLVSLFDDSHPLVRINSIAAATQLVRQLTSLQWSNRFQLLMPTFFQSTFCPAADGFHLIRIL